MRKILFIVFSLFLSLISCKYETRLKVISLNIRYDNPRDGVNAWPNRKDIVVDFLEGERADIFGLQEVLFHQYSYIDSLLPEYSSVYAGRDDGKKKGEMSPVFYNSKRFKALESNTFWLSETPGIPGSKGWGAVLPRVVTWVKLYDRTSEEEHYFFNTHFSHMSDSARLMSSLILAEQVREISGNSKFVITGDFNMLPDSKAYKALTRDGGNMISDTYLITKSDPEGASYTYNGFKNEPGSGRIDYIFVKEGTVIYTHETLKIKKDSIFISDHWPVKTSLLLK